MYRLSIFLLVVVFCTAFIGCDGCSKKKKDDDGGGGTPPPGTIAANFTASPTSGNAPLTVQFTDESTGDIDTWSWDFGDGGTSTAQNPKHTYENPGTYTVSLTVTGTAGSDTETKTNYITVSSPPPPPNDYIVEFDNVGVCVEDNADYSRLQELGDRLKTWAQYLWDATGGQMCVRKFTIEDNTSPTTIGQYLILIPKGYLNSSSLGGGVLGMYSPYYDLIYVGGLFYPMTLLHEWAHARLQHEIYEEYTGGRCRCIMGPIYDYPWCDDSNHDTNSWYYSCWYSFTQRYPDWVPQHDTTGEWDKRKSQPMPSVTYVINDN